MNTNVVCIHLEERLSVAKSLFEKFRFHHLLVVDGDRTLVGVMSDRDLFKALSPNIGLASETSRDLATLNKRVHQVAARKPVALTENAPLSKAIELIETEKISCIPVVDETNTPIGIVSWRDINHMFYQKIVQNE